MLFEKACHLQLIHSFIEWLSHLIRMSPNLPVYITTVFTLRLL